ncbi:MAG TPA: class I SAM-dependent methyltransferase [Gemmataceae bacterium]|jgi:ubiquinone/menaquinone biosynthesis C-methylase UbiE|nr:class I SAM-dependent methyltransferase [Gemmataceae bacterium]
MLERQLEPEVMDSAEEARDYDAMDHSAVNRVFVADFLAVWDGRGPVLDMGTGTAQIPIELCRQHKNAQITAIDMAEHMLAVARTNVRKTGFADRIRLEKQDAKALSYADGAFGAVISNSIIHHIPQPERCLAEMIRVCAPQGTIFVRDLMRPADERSLQLLVEAYAGNANAHQQRMFTESLHAALTLDEIRELAAEAGFSTETVDATSDRHWTWLVVK